MDSTSHYNSTHNQQHDQQKEDKLHTSKRQVDEVVGIMRQNVASVMEREGRLADLDRRANDLESASHDFSRAGTRLRKKMWWENMKMKLCIGGTLVVVVIILIVVIVIETKPSSNSGGGGATTSTPN